MAQDTPGADHYERGLLMKKVQSFDSALKEFQQATKDPTQAGKAFAQVALCLKTLNRPEEAVTAFRQALETGPFSTKERVHILYLLGETLEVTQSGFRSLGGLSADPARGADFPERRCSDSRIEFEPARNGPSR